MTSTTTTMQAVAADCSSRDEGLSAPRRSKLRVRKGFRYDLCTVLPLEATSRTRSAASRFARFDFSQELIARLLDRAPEDEQVGTLDRESWPPADHLPIRFRATIPRGSDYLSQPGPDDVGHHREAQEGRQRDNDRHPAVDDSWPISITLRTPPRASPRGSTPRRYRPRPDPRAQSALAGRRSSGFRPGAKHFRSRIRSSGLWYRLSRFLAIIVSTITPRPLDSLVLMWSGGNEDGRSCPRACASPLAGSHRGTAPDPCDHVVEGGTQAVDVAPDVDVGLPPGPARG